MGQPAFYISTTAAHRIPVYAWLPETEPAAVLLIAHGMAEYAERYSAVADLLVNGGGLAIYAHDQRGHGNTVDRQEDQGIVDKEWFEHAVKDILDVVEALREKHPGKKLFLMGHSMGSFVAQRYFQLFGNKIDGLILSATNGKRDPLLGAGIALSWLQMKLLGKNHHSRLLSSLTFGQFNKAFRPNRTDFDWLSRDEQQVDAYVNDPQCGFTVSSTFFHYFFRGIASILEPYNINSIPDDVPVYAFAGDKDPVGLQGKGFAELVRKWTAAGNARVSHRLYKDGRHEMLNEINRDEVTGDLLAWIRQHC